jgi:hypothetical protein
VKELMMKNLLAVLVLAVLMVSSLILVGGCQQCANTNGRVAATPAEPPGDNANQNQNNDNGSEWYGSEAGSDR